MANLLDERKAQEQAAEIAMQRKLSAEDQKKLQDSISRELAQKNQRQNVSHQRSDAEREAHRAAEDKAFEIAKETEGAQNLKVTTTFSDNQAKSEITGRSINRQERLSNQQFQQSGAPLNLQGDPQAIQKLRAEAFQLARERGGTIDQAAVNRATRDILAEKGNSVSIIDEAGRREAVKEAYQDLKFNYSFGEGRPIVDDPATLVPASGIRSRSVFEGFTGAGDKQTVVISPPKIETFTIKEKPISGDPIAGFVAPFYNIKESVGFTLSDLFLGRKVPRVTADSKTGFIESKSGMPDFRPEAEASVINAAIESGSSTFQGKPTVAPFENMFTEFRANPAYFAGSAVGSAAIWLTPAGASKAIGRFVGAGAAKAIPRARFDYNPLLGSFADRPSVRFGPYNPTRWENPEALADLSKFTMSVDLPKGAKIAPIASIRTVEAFENVRGRQDVIVRTRGGSLVVKQEPIIQATKVEPLSVQIAKESKAATSGLNVAKPLGFGRGITSPKVTLGLGGLTGAERKRKRSESSFSTELETVAFPRETRIFENLRDASRLTTSQRAFSDLIPRVGLGQTNRQDIVQKTSLNTMLREIQQSATAQTQLSAQMTKQLTQQLNLQTTITSVRTVFDTPIIPELTIPRLPTFPFGNRKNERKGKKGKRTRATPREGQIKDLVTVALGEQNKFAKSFRRTFGKAF